MFDYIVLHPEDTLWIVLIFMLGWLAYEHWANRPNGKWRLRP